MERKLRPRKTNVNNENHSKEVGKNQKTKKSQSQPVKEKIKTKQRKSTTHQSKQTDSKQSIKKYLVKTNEIDTNKNDAIMTRRTKKKLEEKNALENVYSFEDTTEDINTKAQGTKTKKGAKKNKIKSGTAKNITTVADMQRKLCLAQNNNQNDKKQNKFIKTSIKDFKVTFDLNFLHPSKPIKKAKTNAPKGKKIIIKKVQKDKEMEKTEIPKEQSKHVLIKKYDGKKMTKDNIDLVTFTDCHLDDEEKIIGNENNNAKEMGKNNEIKETKNPVKIVSDEILRNNKFNINEPRKTIVPNTNPFRQTNIFAKRFTQQNLASLNCLSPIEKDTNFNNTAKQGFSQNKNIIQSTPLPNHMKPLSSNRKVLGESTQFNRMVSPSKGHKRFQNKNLISSTRPITRNILKENIEPSNSNNFTVEAVIEVSPSNINRNYSFKNESVPSKSVVPNDTINFDKISYTDNLPTPVHQPDFQQHEGGAVSRLQEKDISESSDITSGSSISNESEKLIAENVDNKSEKPKVDIKKKNETNYSLSNAFGFDSIANDDSKIVDQQQTSITKHFQVKSNVNYLKKLKKHSHSPVVKALVNDIKEIILTDNISSRNKSAETSDQVISDEQKELDSNQKSNDTTDWSNTFDIDSFKNKKDQDDSIHLFEDYEVHFKEPAKHSYTRKRHLSSHSENEDIEEHDQKKKGTKRKKAGNKAKVSKEEKEWLKNINKTFEEIEHFDLCVE